MGKWGIGEDKWGWGMKPDWLQAQWRPVETASKELLAAALEA